jgi:hypothetical protein
MAMGREPTMKFIVGRGETIARHQRPLVVRTAEPQGEKKALNRGGIRRFAG